MNTDTEIDIAQTSNPTRFSSACTWLRFVVNAPSHNINRNRGCAHECKHSPDSTTGVPDSSKTAVMNAASRSNISSSACSCLRYVPYQSRFTSFNRRSHKATPLTGSRELLEELRINQSDVVL